jgi:hypothetical protein
MAILLATHWHKVTGYFFARVPGVYSSIQGTGTSVEGEGAVLMFTLLGAFCGLVTGLVLVPIFRFVSFMAGRRLGSGTWIVAGTAMGALLFLLWALLGEDPGEET